MTPESDSPERPRTRQQRRRPLILALVIALLVALGVGAAPAAEPVAAQANALPSLSDVAGVAMCGGAGALVPVVGALCITGKVGSKAVAALKNKIKGTAFEKIVQDIADGWERTFLMALSWWIQVPSPALTESTSKFCARNTQTNEVTCPGGSFNSTLQKIGDYTFYLQILGLIGSLIFMAIRMGLANRGLVEETEDLWKTLGRAMFAVTLLGTFIILGMQFSDRLARSALHL